MIGDRGGSGETASSVPMAQTPGNHRPLIVVAGPTASSKTSVAIAIAKKINAEIISLDSVQVYKEMDIGAAKVSKAEQSAVRHHLIDLFDPNHEFNLAEYLKLANSKIKELREDGKDIVVTGGTNLYLTHLLHGVAELPPADKNLREKLEELSNQELFEKLKDLDPRQSEKLHVNDRVRLIRAIETSSIMGSPSSSALEIHSYGDTPETAIVLVLMWEREKLYERINQRTEKMIAAGLLDETRSLAAKYGSNLQSCNTIGYREALKSLSGEIGEWELGPEIAMQTRRYAKRQITFWRNEPQKRGWIVRPNEGDESVVLDQSSETKTRKNEVKNIKALDYDFEQLMWNLNSRRGSSLLKTEVWFINAERLLSSVG